MPETGAGGGGEGERRRETAKGKKTSTVREMGVGRRGGRERCDRKRDTLREQQ